MKKPTRLPPIELIEASFKYDPVLGTLIRNSGSSVTTWDRTSNCPKIRIGRKTTSVSRVCWALYHRQDPIGKMIKHINGNPFDNRIANLKAVKL